MSTNCENHKKTPHHLIIPYDINQHFTSTASGIPDLTPRLSEDLFDFFNKYEYNENCFSCAMLLTLKFIMK